MLRLLVCIVAFVAIFASAANGEWGSVAIGVILLLGVMVFLSGHGKDVRAWDNIREYWATGSNPFEKHHRVTKKQRRRYEELMIPVRKKYEARMEQERMEKLLKENLGMNIDRTKYGPPCRCWKCNNVIPLSAWKEETERKVSYNYFCKVCEMWVTLEKQKNQ